MQLSPEGCGNRCVREPNVLGTGEPNDDICGPGGWCQTAPRMFCTGRCVYYGKRSLEEKEYGNIFDST